MCLSSSNSQRVINMATLAEILGTDICNSLPNIHTFIGCDFTAAFMHKSKVSPSQLIERIMTFSFLGKTWRVKYFISCYYQLKGSSVQCTTYPRPRRSVYMIQCLLSMI